MNQQQMKQTYSSDDDSTHAILASEMIMEDCELFDEVETMYSGRTTQNSVTSGKLPPLPTGSQSRASTSTSGNRSIRTTPKTAWDEVGSESNSPVPTSTNVVRNAKEYLSRDEARRRALMLEQQQALTEYMIFGARANIDDMSANGAVPPSATSNPMTQSTSNQRLPRLRREELSGIGISKIDSGYETTGSGGYDPKLFSAIVPVPVKYGQLAPLSSHKKI